MSIDTKEYAQLAARVYATTDTNVLGIPSGWSIVGNLIKDQPDGFSAGVFRKGVNEIVIAYTGTNADKLTDMQAANAPAALGFYSTQVLKAMKLYIETRIANPTANITFTGHSLGGGLAGLMAVYFGKPATTFDAAPFQASAVNAGLLADYKNELARINLSDPDFNLYAAATTLINQNLFSQREASVNSFHLKGEFLNVPRASFNTIYGGVQQEIAVGENKLSAFQLHSMVLLSATQQSTSFLNAIRQNSSALDLIFDAKFYFRDDEKSGDVNFLNKALNSQVLANGTSGTGSAGMLSALAADLQKLGTDIAGLNQAAKDAITAQGIEWYYHHNSYTGQQFITVTNSVLQYTVANAAGFDVTDNKASAWAVKWTTPLLNAEDQFGGAFAINYDQWNVSGSAGGSATARDATKSQIFIGNSGADTFTGGDQADVILAAGGDDTLNGGAGADLLYGGAGNDTLNGGTGSDFLYGSAGNDTYTFTGNWGSDIIVDDSAGQGSILVDGVTIVGGKKIAGQDNVWQNTDQGYTFTLAGTAAGPLLVISKNGSMNTIRVQGWQSGQLGLVMNDTPAAAPSVNQIFNGDQRALLIGIETDLQITPGSATYNTYKWAATSRAADGTLIGGIAEANFSDVIYGSGGNDKIFGLGGNDALSGGAGQDEIEGGDGDDLIGGGQGSDRILGGAGNDYINSSDRDDDVYATESGDNWVAVGRGANNYYQFRGGEGAYLLVKSPIRYLETEKKVSLNIGGAHKAARIGKMRTANAIAAHLCDQNALGQLGVGVSI